MKHIRTMIVMSGLAILCAACGTQTIENISDITKILENGKDVYCAVGDDGATIDVYMKKNYFKGVMHDAQYKEHKILNFVDMKQYDWKGNRGYIGKIKDMSFSGFVKSIIEEGKYKKDTHCKVVSLSDGDFLPPKNIKRKDADNKREPIDDDVIVPSDEKMGQNYTGDVE